MPQKVYHVHLMAKERVCLEGYVKQGKRSARALTRARVLLLADEQYSDDDIIETLGVSRRTVCSLRKKYTVRRGQHILDLLQEAPRPGQPLKLDTRVAAHAALIACSEPPTGAARWTLQLIADRLVELKVVEAICLESVRKALKKMPSNPG
jgi:putative transposase